MIVGKTGSGKSEAWKCLQRTLGKLKASHPDVDSFQRVHVYTINPLSLSNDELYGSFEEVRGASKVHHHVPPAVRTVCALQELQAATALSATL
jgi:dynein heavy chain